MTLFFTNLKGATSGLGMLIFLLALSLSTTAQRLPYEIINNSEFSDDEVFVAIVGEELPGGKFIWVDPVNGRINRMSRSDNTVQGPIIGGNRGPGLNGRYANAFRKLSQIPGNTLQIPQIAGCRIFISYKSQLYLYFFGYDSDPRGYAGANLENETDPNTGIAFEVIELTYNEFGIFNNTSRVDAFQFPIGLEVQGPGFFKQVGELVSRQTIFDRWEQTAPPAFRGLLNRREGIIKFPTKSPTFPRNYLDGYIDAIWNKYRNQELFFSSEAGNWRGGVQGNNFVVRRESDGQIATIPGKPTTVMAMEGSGVMARGGRWDLVVQAQFVAAITRHAIDLNAPSGSFQNWGDASKYYRVEPYNWYAKFFHRPDISFEGQTYAFAYDDVYNQSATIAFNNPSRAKITLGPISPGGTPPPLPTPANTVTTVYKDCPFGGYAIGLGVGSYTLAQLRARGVLDNDISSLRVNSGFEVTLYADDNFGGQTITLRGNDACLDNDGWNDRASSIRVRPATSGNGSLRIEAENFTAQEGIQTENSSEGGLNVGFTDPGDFMVYANVTFPVTAAYTIEYRVASAVGGGRISTDLNSGRTILGAINVPNTGGWQNWTTVRQTVNVQRGTYPLGLFSVSGGWNLNYINIVGPAGLAYNRTQGVVAANPGPVARIDRLDDTADFSVYPNPTASDRLTIEGAGGSVVSLLSLEGRELARYRIGSNRQTVALPNLSAGVYLLSSRNGERTATRKLVVR